MRSTNSMHGTTPGISRHKAFPKFVIIKLLVVFFIAVFGKETFAQRGLYMERPRLGMDVSFEYEEDIRTDPFTDTEKTSKRFKEQLEIETAGYVYHPALLIFRLGYLPEWEQNTRSEEGGVTRRTKSFLNGYNTEFTFLKFKPYTLILNANKNTSTTRSNFAERSVTESDLYGARFILKYPILPSSVSFYHTASDQSGLYETQTRKDEITLNMRHHKYLGTTVFETNYFDSIDSAPLTTIETNRFKVSLNNNYAFTEDKDIVLNSVFGYDDRDSTNSITRRYHILENLYWINTSTLTTSYALRYDKRNGFDKLRSIHLRTESKSIGFNLNHLLYENLKTNFSLDAQENNSSSARIDIYGSRLNFTYTRRIPVGVLNLTSGFDYRIFDIRPRTDTTVIFDEPLVLKDGVITFLLKENIIISSIVIEDDRGFRYSEGADYTVNIRGSRVGIRPVFSVNNITDPSKTLTVSYEYRGPTFDYSSFGQSYGISLSLWNVWKVYYLLSLSKQKFISGISPESLNDDSTHVAGSELEWKWNRALLEWRDQYTESSPMKNWTFTDSVTVRPDDRTFLTASASYGETRFKDTQDFDKNMGIKSGLQRKVGERGYFDASLFFDKLTGTTNRIITKGFNSNFRWSYNIYDLSFTYDFRNEDDEIARKTSNNNYFLFNIKRALF